KYAKGRGRIIEERLGTGALSYLRSRLEGGQPPDIFAFDPRRLGRELFAEVKGSGDSVTERQRRNHTKVRRRFGVPVIEIQVVYRETKPYTVRRSAAPRARPTREPRDDALARQ